MAAKRPAETVADLIGPHLAKSGLGLTAWCASKGLNPRTVYRMHQGEGTRPYLSTLAKFAAALKVDVARVRAACEASRAAAK